MPVDLDDMFSALGRQADAIPLGDVAAARDRGRQRNRNRTVVVAAFAAVCLAGGGAAWAVRPGPTDRTPPATVRHTLAEVGSPLVYGSKAREAASAISGTAAYTGWQDEDGVVKIAGTDLHTGKPLWPVQSLGRLAGFEGIVAVPGALLVDVVRSGAARSAYVYDPATGERREQTADPDDKLFVAGDLLIRVGAKTGHARAENPATGVQAWSAKDDKRAILTMAMNGSGGGTTERAVETAGDELVQVTEDGEVRVLDTRTGAVRSSLTSPSAVEGTPLAHDWRLYVVQPGRAGQPYRFGVTGLDNQAGDSGLLFGPPGYEFVAMRPCGPERVCVLDRAPDGSTGVSAIDGARGEVLWRVTGPRGAKQLSSRQGRVLVSGGDQTVLLDGNGQPVLSNSAGFDWLDDNRLIALPGKKGGPVVTASALTGDTEVIGRLPATPNPCAHTPDRLACPGATDLRIWAIPG